ncbi:MAG TPA: homoserine dehydrogenase [Candidatus Acidoferrum sp.]|nr:homoserine dehydrogenase [Candidatus Acidoferrum sp.]
MSRPPLRVAVLGAGTVGREVVRAFETAPERLAIHGGPALTLVGVGVRDLAKARASGIPADLLTDAPAHLVASPDTDVIVELMGGEEPARTLIAAALGAGRSVVTANKHVVAHHGAELEAIARRTGAAFRFEAAVAGGIPILGPLAADLAGNRVSRVRGIVNGSTNYLLSAMAAGGRPYADVLAEAQAAGYLEADPSADVEGADAVNKLVILMRLAFGTWVDPDAIVRRPPTAGGAARSAWAGPAGITGVTGAHVAAAGACGLAIKLVADARRLPHGRVVASVVPTAVRLDEPLGRTDGVLNRVEVHAQPVGMVAFAGPGAGGAATSSAVLGDLLAVARGTGSTWAGLPAAVQAARDAVEGPPGSAAGQAWFTVIADGERGRVDARTLDTAIARVASRSSAIAVVSPFTGGRGLLLSLGSLAQMRSILSAVGAPADLVILPADGEPPATAVG